MYGVWKNEDINAVIEVSGDKPHMIVTENGKLIFEGDVRLKKFGDLCFTDGKDGDGNDSGAPYPNLRFNINENVYEYRHLFDSTVITFIKRILKTIAICGYVSFENSLLQLHFTMPLCLYDCVLPPSTYNGHFSAFVGGVVP